MPVAEPSSHRFRRHKTICIPCSTQQYEQVVDDPEAFRNLLDQQIGATPDLFPPEIQRGLPHEGHLHLPQDRLEAPADRTP